MNPAIKLVEDAGFEVYSLARVKSMKTGQVEFLD